MKRILFVGLVLSLAVACVPKAKYDDALAVQQDLRGQNSALEQQLAGVKSELARLDNEMKAAQAALDQANRKLAAKVAEAGALADDVERMQAALREAELRKAKADESLRAYRELVSRFQAMIDAGTLRVKVIDGRMVVEMATDILFPPGSATLSREGVAAIQEVAQVLAGIDREFQVAGHTDNVPISTERFPSNWDLGAARAISVTRLMIESGVRGERMSAASFADYRPADTNRTKEGREINRRIEIIIVPDLSAMPGYGELQDLADGG